MNGIMILCLKYLWVDLDACIVDLFFNAQVIQYFVIQISEHMDDNIGSKDPCEYLTRLVVNIILPSAEVSHRNRKKCMTRSLFRALLLRHLKIHCVIPQNHVIFISTVFVG